MLERWVRFPYELHGQVVKLVDTRRSDRRAINGMGVRLSPWSLRSGLESGFQRGLISRTTPVQIRPPQLDGRVRKSAKRPGREPGESLWVRFPPRLLFDPVVQRRRLLAHIQATMVRVHPGSLQRSEVTDQRSEL